MYVHGIMFRLEIGSNGMVLTLHNVNRKHTGTYNCKVLDVHAALTKLWLESTSTDCPSFRQYACMYVFVSDMTVSSLRPIAPRTTCLTCIYMTIIIIIPTFLESDLMTPP